MSSRSGLSFAEINAHAFPSIHPSIHPYNTIQYIHTYVRTYIRTYTYIHSCVHTYIHSIRNGVNRASHTKRVLSTFFFNLQCPLPILLKHRESMQDTFLLLLADHLPLRFDQFLTDPPSKNPLSPTSDLTFSSGVQALSEAGSQGLRKRENRHGITHRPLLSRSQATMEIILCLGVRRRRRRRILTRGGGRLVRRYSR